MDFKKEANIEHLLSVRDIKKTKQNIVSVLRKVTGNFEREDTGMESQLAKERTILLVAGRQACVEHAVKGTESRMRRWFVLVRQNEVDSG